MLHYCDIFSYDEYFFMYCCSYSSQGATTNASEDTKQVKLSKVPCINLKLDSRNTVVVEYESVRSRE